jgi:hypothetical protein
MKRNRYFNEYIKLIDKEIDKLKKNYDLFLMNEFIMLRTKMIALHKTL